MSTKRIKAISVIGPAFGTLPRLALDDDSAAKTSLAMMHKMPRSEYRAKWFADAAECYAQAEARGLVNDD